MSQKEEKAIPSGQRIQRQVLGFDLSLQVVAALVAVAILYGKLPSSSVYAFLGILAGTLLYRLASQPSDTAASAGAGTWPANLGGLVNGLVWGGFYVSLQYYLLQNSLAIPLQALNALWICVNLAAYIGAALRPLPFALFFVMATGMPLAWSIWAANLEQVIAWILILLVWVVLAFVTNKHNFILSTIRAMTRQNASLLQNLTSARNEALRNQVQLEKANDDIKSQMREREQAEKRIRESEEELSEILSDLQDMYFRVDKAGYLVRASKAAEYVVGYTPQELIGLKWESLLADQRDTGDFIHYLEDNMGRMENYELPLQTKSGDVSWVSVSSHYVYRNGDVAGFEGTARDINEKRRTDEEIFHQKERLHVTLESIGDGVITTDLDGLVVYLNARAEDMTGWITHEAEGNPLSAVFRLVDEDEGKLVELPIVEWMEEGKRTSLSDPVMLVHKSEKRQTAIEITGSSIRDSVGHIVGSVLVFRDVTKLRSLTKQLAHQATHDALTSLPNRVEFEKRVEQALRTSQTSGRPCVIFYIDLDQFKVVNDTCGHHAGDILLQQVTSLMQDLLRVSDTLARLGGDEFGVLLPGCPLKMAEEIAEKLRVAVENYRFVWEGDAFRVSLSVGVVPISSESGGLTELLKAADSACYVAKERGRNCVHVYQPDDLEIAEHQDKMQWMQKIQKALDLNLFELHFQPIVGVSESNKLHGLHGEILLRMLGADKEQGKIIPPGAFLPTAERYHLMPEIDRWVIKNSFQNIQQYIRQGVPLEQCSINLSGQSLGDLKLLDYILKQIKDTGIPGERICFEITESAVIANVDYAKQFINRLKDCGCRFALDDFGSGLSSFDYLKNLPVDYVKLDGSLIRDVATSKVSQAMVHAINYVAHVMGMQSVAEYVENQDILIQLQRISVDFAQGYGIGRPMPFTRNNLLKLH